MTPLAGSWQIVCAAKAVARSRTPCASARFVKSGGLRARQQSAARSTSMDFIAVLESPVSESSGHGRTLAALRLAHSPTLTTQTLKKTMVAVSRCKLEVPNHGPTSPIPVQDAYMIVLQIGPPSRRELWLDGKAKRTEPLTPGEVAFHDLRRQPAFKMYTPVDSLNFHIPRLALDACTDDADTGRIGDLNFKPGIGVNDVTLAALAEALLPAFNYPDQVSQLFLDHVTVAIVAHVAHAFGGMRELARAARGGLAPWQARRATEFLEANLDGMPPVSQPIFSRFSAVVWNAAASMAAATAHRAGHAASARSCYRPSGGGHGLRLRRSESFYARVHPDVARGPRSVATSPGRLNHL